MGTFIKKIDWNRYSVFFLLYGVFLIIASLPPRFYAPVAFNSDVIIPLMVLFIGLLVIVPIYLIALVIADFKAKNYKRLSKVLLVFILLFAIFYFLRKYVWASFEGYFS